MSRVKNHTDERLAHIEQMLEMLSHQTAQLHWLATVSVQRRSSDCKPPRKGRTARRVRKKRLVRGGIVVSH